MNSKKDAAGQTLSPQIVINHSLNRLRENVICHLSVAATAVLPGILCLWLLSS